MATHEAPLSLGFSRQEHWSGLPFPSPMQESENWKWSRSVVSYSSWPHGLQPTRLGIFQARVLEWGAFSTLTSEEPSNTSSLYTGPWKWRRSVYSSTLWLKLASSWTSHVMAVRKSQWCPYWGLPGYSWTTVQHPAFLADMRSPIHISVLCLQV